jgi:Domain of unknown function (DUF2382)
MTPFSPENSSNDSNNNSQDHHLELAVDKYQHISTISLLEERLVVDRYKSKVGEVIIRKEVETQIIEVPIRREKLIVEQITPEYKQIAVIDLGSHHSSSINQNEYLVKAKFDSVELASQFLEAIAHLSNLDLSNAECKSVEVSIEVENALTQEAYQQLLQNFLRR